MVSKNMNLIICKLKKLKNMNLIFCKFKKAQKTWNFFCKPKKLKTHESNFYQNVKLFKSLKTASKDPELVPGKCSSFWTESGWAPISNHCTFEFISFLSSQI